MAKAHDPAKHRDWWGSRGCTCVGRLGRGDQLGVVVGSRVVSRHLFVDTTTLLGASDSPRRRVSSRVSADVAGGRNIVAHRTHDGLVHDCGHARFLRFDPAK